MRTWVTGLARERNDVGNGVSRPFGIFSCCLLSSAPVLTIGSKLKRFSSTLPMFVLVLRNALNDVYFLLA